MSFPDLDPEICLFIDASLHGWSILVRQVGKWEGGISVERQEHRLIVCKGGMFRAASANSITEK
ncbi:hypothetical protein PybrP1_010587 [[Pythium] brassicae (nom. inval.)]|nr:hypothetical protein PybrP1_010587 [[Pythium] brassicae (nom. inval.)]